MFLDVCYCFYFLWKVTLIFYEIWFLLQHKDIILIQNSWVSNKCIFLGLLLSLPVYFLKYLFIYFLLIFRILSV